MSLLIDSYNKLFERFGSTSLHNGKDMLFYPKIGKRKARKLKKLYLLGDDETILYARNCKFKSSFKKGMVITDRTLRLRATDSGKIITVNWAKVLYTNYDEKERCITINYLIGKDSTFLNIPMKFFLKKKKFYVVGAESIFLPLIDTLVYTTRTKSAGISDSEILNNIVSIPDNIEIERTKATNWILLLFTAIGSILLFFLLSQNKSGSKSNNKKSSMNNVPLVSAATGSKFLKSGSVPSKNPSQIRANPVVMVRPKYERLPNGQCVVTDILGRKNTYPSFEMASNLTDFFSGFPITSSTYSSSDSVSPSGAKPDPQTEYLKKKNAEIDSLTRSRDDAVRKYREAKARNDKREMDRWASEAHDKQGAINVRVPVGYSIDRDVKGIDF